MFFKTQYILKVESFLGRAKKKINAYKKLPKCLSEVKVDGDDRLTSEKKTFLIYDNNSSERILIFASEMGLKMLSETFVWHAEGMFYEQIKFFSKQIFCSALYLICSLSRAFISK